MFHTKKEGGKELVGGILKNLRFSQYKSSASFRTKNHWKIFDNRWNRFVKLQWTCFLEKKNPAKPPPRFKVNLFIIIIGVPFMMKDFILTNVENTTRYSSAKVRQNDSRIGILFKWCISHYYDLLESSKRKLLGCTFSKLLPSFEFTFIGSDTILIIHQR